MIVYKKGFSKHQNLCHRYCSNVQIHVYQVLTIKKKHFGASFCSCRARWLLIPLNRTLYPARYINTNFTTFLIASSILHDKMTLLLLSLCVLFAPVATSKLTTFLKDTNLTSVEERLSFLEQKMERRLGTTERLLGQLLTGQADARLEDLDILTLRSGKCWSKLYGDCIMLEDQNVFI